MSDSAASKFGPKTTPLLLAVPAGSVVLMREASARVDIPYRTVSTILSGLDDEVEIRRDARAKKAFK